MECTNFFMKEEGDKDGEIPTYESNYILHNPPEVFYLKIENKNQKGVFVSHNVALSIRKLTNDLTNTPNEYPIYQSRRTRIAFSYIIRKNEYLVDEKKYQVYAGFGLGVRITLFLNYMDNDPHSQDDDVLHFFVPLAFEAVAGFRYYMFKNSGFYLEAGSAKSLVQGGLFLSW